MAVSDSERNIDSLKKDNEELRARLYDLQINSEDTPAPSAAGGKEDEFKEMTNEITQLSKDYEMMQDKFKRVNIVSD